MYVVDLIGGPMDGLSYAFPSMPSVLYFPFVPEVVALLPGPAEEDYVPTFATPKAVYRRIINHLYWYQGTID